MPPTTHKLLLSISSLLKTLWSGVHLKRSSMSKHVKLWHTVGNKPQSTKRHERAKEHKSEEKSHLTKMGRGVSDAGLKSKGERNRPTQNIYKCTIDIMTPKKGYTSKKNKCGSEEYGRLEADRQGGTQREPV